MRRGASWDDIERMEKLMSTVAGTSWGSPSTLGVAMVATGAALGAPLPLVAGAVVSGASRGRCRRCSWRRLGVSTIEYAPWAVFCYGGPVRSSLIAASYGRLQFGLVKGAYVVGVIVLRNAPSSSMI